jgi:hypothetical protein
MARRMLIDPAEWDDVSSDLGTAITDWARGLTTEEWDQLHALGLPAEWSAVRESDDFEDGDLILWRRQEFETALGQVEFVAPQSTASGYASSAFADRDPRTGYIETTYIDAELGSVALQIHAWGEVRYG